MKKLHIIFRSFPGLSKKTPVQLSTKNELLDVTIDSLFSSLKSFGKDYKFTFINDSYEADNYVEKKLKKAKIEYEVKDVVYPGNGGSFLSCLIEAVNSDCSNIFFCEDDYFFSNTFGDIAALFCNENMPFFTPYWHPNYDQNGGFGQDNISLSSEGSLGKIYDVPSTTLTFFAKKEAVMEQLANLSTFARGNGDHKMWLDITGKKLSPLDYLRYDFMTMRRHIFLDLTMTIRDKSIKKSSLYSIFPSHILHLDRTCKIVPLYDKKDFSLKW